MKIYTSYLAKLRQIEELGFQPIGIATSPPKWAQIPHCKKVAPHFWMLKLKESDYNHHYNIILSKLNQAAILKELQELSGGKDIVLLCFEKDPLKCHRTMVANWLNAAGQDIKELEIQKSLFSEKE